MSVTALRKPKVTLGSLTDQMYALREERRILAKKDDDLKTQYDTLEHQLIDLLKAEGTSACKGMKASASIKSEEQFSFDQDLVDGKDGFERFMAFVAKNKFWHLVQRRISAPAARELFATKGKLPGVTPYLKESINLRTV